MILWKSRISFVSAFLFINPTNKKPYFCSMKNLVVLFALLLTSLTSWSQTDNEKAGNFYNEGTKLIGEKKFKEAIAEFDKAISIIPRFPEAIFNKGNCLLMLKQNNEACQLIQQSAEMGYEPAKNYHSKYCLNSTKNKGKK